MGPFCVVWWSPGGAGTPVSTHYDERRSPESTRLPRNFPPAARIEQVEDSCRLTVTRDRLREDANEGLSGGWPMVLSGLKTLLETGETLTTPGSLRWGSTPAAGER